MGRRPEQDKPEDLPVNEICSFRVKSEGYGAAPETLSSRVLSFSLHLSSYSFEFNMIEI
jgi:hypothetical protein